MPWYERFFRKQIESLAEQRLANAFGGEWHTFNEAAYDTAYDFEFNQPFAGRVDGQLGYPAADRIREWGIEERRSILLRAHLAWERHPLAKGAVRIIRGFVVGTGLNVTYRNKQVEEVLERFRLDNRRKLQRWEREWFAQLLKDGEVFIRLFTIGELAAFRASALTIKPWLVDGIVSEAGNRDNIEAYQIHPETGTGAVNDPYTETGALENIPAAEIIHCKINAVGYETRGRTELFAIFPWLRAYREWLEQRARINRYKGMLYHLKLTGATSTQVTAKRGVMRQPPAPNAIYVSSDAEELVELPGNPGADRAAEDGRQIKLMNIMGLGLPEYMLSEGENANLATARSQQLPALRSFLEYQDIYVNELWRPLYESVLEAYGLDLFSEVPEHDKDGKETGKTIRVFEAFDVTTDSMTDEDPKNLAEALTLDMQNRLVSRETASAQRGYDYYAEREKMNKEDAEEVDAVMQGRKLGNVAEPVGAAVSRNGSQPNEDDDEEDDT